VPQWRSWGVKTLGGTARLRSICAGPGSVRAGGHGAQRAALGKPSLAGRSAGAGAAPQSEPRQELFCCWRGASSPTPTLRTGQRGATARRTAVQEGSEARAGVRGGRAQRGRAKNTLDVRSLGEWMCPSPTCARLPESSEWRVITTISWYVRTAAAGNNAWGAAAGRQCALQYCTVLYSTVACVDFTLTS